MEQFKRGFSAAFAGISTAFGDRGVHRTYFKLIFAILALAILVVGGGVWGILALTEPSADTAQWLAWGLVALRVIGIVIVVVVGPVLAILITNVAFPLFNEGVFMAGMRAVDPVRAEQLAGYPGLPVPVTVGIGLTRLGFFLLLSAGCFLFGLVPVVGTVGGPLLQGYVTARTVGWELLDPYFERLGWTWDRQRKFLKDNQWAILGFGLPISFALAIPIIGPLLFGIFQAAAAHFVREVLEGQHGQPELLEGAPPGSLGTPAQDAIAAQIS